MNWKIYLIILMPLKVFRSNNIYIRKMIHADAPVVLTWENEPENWLVSEGEGPYVLDDIIDLVNNIEDIHSSCQVRYIIFENDTERPLGTVDLFNMDFNSGSAGIGILIADRQDRRKGFGKESVLLVEDVANHLGIKRIIAVVHKSNEASLALFRSCDYEFLREEVEENPKHPDYLHKIVLEKCIRN